MSMYLVSYTFANKSGNGFGNIELESSGICSYDEILSMQEEIKARNDHTNVTILSWNKFEKPQ